MFNIVNAFLRFIDRFVDDVDDIVPSSPIAIQIDHVVIAGKDLDQLRARFDQMGLESVEGSVRANGLTHNALIAFTDGSYLELVAPMIEKTAPDDPWWEFMVNDSGICAWAIRSEDIDADVALYRSFGMPISSPITEYSIRPDGVRVEWRTAVFGGAPVGAVLPFLFRI